MFLPDTKRERKEAVKARAPELGEDGHFIMSNEKKEEMKQEFKERISILCVAYHNLGVQQEFMKMYTEALESYKMATQFSFKYFGVDNAIFQSMNEVYKKAKTVLTGHIQRQMEKSNKPPAKPLQSAMAMTESRKRAVSANRTGGRNDTSGTGLMTAKFGGARSSMVYANSLKRGNFSKRQTANNDDLS